MYRLPFLRQHTTSATGRANASGVLRKLQDLQESTKDYSKAATARRKGTSSQAKETSRGRGTNKILTGIQQEEKRGQKVNNVTLSGRLTKEPDIRYGGENNSVAIARFTLAVDDYKSTDFINIRALGKTAEWVEKWLQKGNKVELVGKIKTGHYTGRDGKEIYYTEVLTSSVSFGETKAEAQQRQQAAGDRPQPTPSGDGFMDIPDGYDDGLPFD